METEVVLVDDPAPQVRRVTLNRPEKRNALNHALRGGILRALQEADRDPEVRVMIVRGAGKSFSSAAPRFCKTRAFRFPAPGWRRPKACAARVRASCS